MKAESIEQIREHLKCTTVQELIDMLSQHNPESIVTFSCEDIDSEYPYLRYFGERGVEDVFGDETGDSLGTQRIVTIKFLAKSNGDYSK